MSSSKTIFLAAGGTGGHLFPAQSLATELSKRGHICHLLTDTRGLKFASGFQGAVHVVPSATLASKSPVAIAKTLLALGRGFVASAKLIKAHKPSVVIGFGGYPSLPPMAAALSKRVPCVLHEQNGVMGKANRLIARKMQAVMTGFEQPLRTPEGVKTLWLGNPVREAVLKLAGNPYSFERGGRINLLIFGGSQGASILSQHVTPALCALPEALKSKLHVVQQVRAEDQDAVIEQYQAAGLSHEIAPFFDDLPQKLAEAALIIARSGASTVAELTVLGRPSILVPLKQSLDGDQAANAASLARAGGALVLPQDQLITGAIKPLLHDLLHKPDVCAAMAASAKSQGRPDAALAAADQIERIAV